MDIIDHLLLKWWRQRCYMTGCNEMLITGRSFRCSMLVGLDERHAGACYRSNTTSYGDVEVE
jgi:hypothetical protein